MANDCSTGSLSGIVKPQPTAVLMLRSDMISVTAKVPIWLTSSVKPGRCALEVDDFSTNVALRAPLGFTSENMTIPVADRLRFPATESSTKLEPLLAVCKKNSISDELSTSETGETVPLPIPGIFKSKG